MSAIDSAERVLLRQRFYHWCSECRTQRAPRGTWVDAQRSLVEDVDAPIFLCKRHARMRYPEIDAREQVTQSSLFPGEEA